MLTIRFQRTGRENTPTFRLVLAERARAVKGKYQEKLGFFLPARNPPIFQFNEERILYWIGKGAQPTNTAARVLSRAGIKGLEKFIVRYVHRKPKGESEEAAPPAKEVPTTQSAADTSPPAP